MGVTDAINAFDKSFENPPKKTVQILADEEYNKISPDMVHE